MSIKSILQKYPEASDWHSQYPWFSVGQLVNAFYKKDNAEFETAAQRTAVFFNDIPRLHWLIHQLDWDEATIFPITQETTATTASVASLVETVKPDSEPLPEPLELEAVENGSTEHNSIAAVEEVGSPIPEGSHFHPVIDLSKDPADPEVLEEIDMDTTDLAEMPTVLSASLAQAVQDLKNNVADDTLEFRTAYQHTIDYFASQGIKLDQEPDKDDQFGQQLKTFTSWLRHMKRLPDVQVQQADLLVETNAADSLQKGEVLTESMADVLLKQGKKEQAIKLLEKLSLLHPEKLLYFAARIDQIKRS